jgi:hypothetical protein
MRFLTFWGEMRFLTFWEKMRFLTFFRQNEIFEIFDFLGEIEILDLFSPNRGLMDLVSLETGAENDFVKVG